MVKKTIHVLATAILSQKCSAFHLSQLSGSTRLGTTSLFYQQNRTAQNEYQRLRYQESAEATVEEQPTSYSLDWETAESQLQDKTHADEFLDQYYQSEELAEVDDESVQHYYEDGTPYESLNPSLSLLKEWTQEYIDAIDLAGGFLTRISVGVENMLAPEFVYTTPSIGPINKADLIELMRYYNDNGLDISSAVPDLTVTYEGWHQDPHEPWRVWAMARYSGTHLGTVHVPGTGLKLTPPNHGDRPVKFTTGPEVQSFLWTADKKLLWHTMGYVGDLYTGSNQGHGGLDGLLVSLGLPHLYLEATGPMREVKSWISQFREDVPKTKSPFSQMPLWWHERKTYELNIHR